MAFLYFIIAAGIFVIRGVLLDDSIRTSLHDIAVHETGLPVEVALQHVQQQLWIGRVMMLGLFAIAAYILAELATRPLKRSAERRRRFIANVSHELRTPLAIMRTAAEVALRHPDRMTHDQAVNILSAQLEETARMSRIIQFLLEYAKLDQRSDRWEMVPVSIQTVSDASRVHLMGLARERNVAVEFRIGTERICGNATALEEIFVNLVRNAIQYTPSGGKVTVSTRHDHMNVSLVIMDTGVGIPPQDLSQIFEPFFRSSTAEHSSDGGLGLGLSIVKELVQLHKGSIDVESEVGKGTTFTVTFPLVKG